MHSSGCCALVRVEFCWEVTGNDNEEVTSFANFPGGKLGIDDFFVAVWKGP